MSEISDSRFNMWRAVVAMAHADHVIAPEEVEYVEKYIATVPFTEEQAEILRGDLKTKHPIADSLSKITEPTDRGEFFMFARMLLWCDGDFDAQEEKIFEMFKEVEMARLDLDSLRTELVQQREDDALRRELTHAIAAEHAENVVWNAWRDYLGRPKVEDDVA